MQVCTWPGGWRRRADGGAVQVVWTVIRRCGGRAVPGACGNRPRHSVTGEGFPRRARRARVLSVALCPRFVKRASVPSPSPGGSGFISNLRALRAVFAAAVALRSRPALRVASRRARPVVRARASRRVACDPLSLPSLRSLPLPCARPRAQRPGSGAHRRRVCAAPAFVCSLVRESSRASHSRRSARALLRWQALPWGDASGGIASCGTTADRPLLGGRGMMTTRTTPLFTLFARVRRARPP